MYEEGCICSPLIKTKIGFAGSLIKTRNYNQDGGENGY